MTGAPLDSTPSDREDDAVRTPVTRKLFRAALLLYLGAAVLITAAFVAEAWYSARADLTRELSVYRRTLEEALAAPLWSVDIEAITAIGTGMLEIPDITGVHIVDHSRTHDFAVLGEPALAGWLSPSIMVEFPVYYRHAIGRDLVGWVTLSTSPLALAERLQWRIALLVVSALLKTIILWIIFERLGRSILARPLIALTRAVREAGRGHRHPVIFDSATAAAAQGTEIALLQSAYNDLIEALDQGQGEIATLNRELEGRVHERTQALEARTVELSAAVARVDAARRQAAAALEAAERAGRAKSEFLALVSHELRTPLNSILGFAEMVRDRVGDGTDPQRMSDYAAAIHTSGVHLLTLINDILDLSKIEAGQMEMRIEWIDPAATARAVTDLMRDQAVRKGLSIACRLEPSIGPLRADPRRFRQMLINLLSNSVKYTEAPGSVTIQGRVTEAGWLAVEVVDTGVGMRTEDIALALAVFGRVDNPATRDEQGTGLGLPLVAHMARLHGGRLSVESRPGVGTSATLWFPPTARIGFPGAGEPT